MTLFGKKQTLSIEENAEAYTRTVNELFTRMISVLNDAEKKGITADAAILVVGALAARLIEDLAIVSNRKDAETYVLQKIQSVVEKFRTGLADKI